MKKMWKRIVVAALVLSMLLSVPGGVTTQASGESEQADTSLWDTTTLFAQSVETQEYTDWDDTDNIVPFKFKSAAYGTKENTWVFAAVGTPDAVKFPTPEGGYPAVVLVHGGGGQVFPDWIKYWNDKGYVAIAIDMYSRQLEMQDETLTAVSNPDGGPAYDKDGSNYDSVDNPEQSWVYHSVYNVIMANNYLRQRTDVNSEKIAITGISWGGFITNIVAGVDTRFAAFAPVYGSGYVYDDSAWVNRGGTFGGDRKEEWISLYDPSSYLPNAEKPMLFVSGVNDEWFSAYNRTKTAELVPQSVPVSYSQRSDIGHGWTWAKTGEICSFFDKIMDNTGGTAAQFAEIGTISEADGTASVTITGGSFDSVNFVYTTSTDADSHKWTWETEAVTGDNGTYTHAIPSNVTAYLFETVGENFRQSTKMQLKVEQVDVTASVTMSHLGTGVNRGIVKITLGDKNLLPADGTGSYCVNDHKDTNGVDLMEYIYVNGESARSIVNRNKNGETNYGSGNTTDAPLKNGWVFAPVCVTVQSNYLEFKYLEDFVNSFDLKLTLKAGLKWRNNSGEILTIAKDVTYMGMDYNDDGNGFYSGHDWRKVTEEIDITNKIEMKNQGTGAGRGIVNIYFGNYSVKTAGGRGGYYVNDYNDVYNGVDLLANIEVNGKSARELVAANKNGDTSYQKDTTDSSMQSSSHAPVLVTVQTTWMELKYVTSYIDPESEYNANQNLVLTVKKGLNWLNDQGQLLKVTEDVTFKFANGTWTRCLDVTDEVRMVHLGDDQKLNRGLVNIYFGSYSVKPAGDWTSWCMNDNYTHFKTDLLKYVYVNGRSARELVTENQTSKEYNGKTTDGPLSLGGIWAPVSVTVIEYKGSTYLEVKYLTAYASLNEGLEITLKAGLKWPNADGQVLELTKDVTYGGMDWNEDSTVTNSTEWEKAYDLSVYRAETDADGNYTTYPTKEGSVFAGWYSVGGQPIDASVTDGHAYAKFTDKNVLTVKAQVSADTTAESDKASLRFVTTVDGVKYQKVGFKVTANGITKDYSSKKVYNTLYAIGTDGEVMELTPQVFSSSSKHFKASMIQGIPNEAFDTEFNATPYWITLDGTMVCGEETPKSVTMGIEAR